MGVCYSCISVQHHSLVNCNGTINSKWTSFCSRPLTALVTLQNCFHRYFRVGKVAKDVLGVRSSVVGTPDKRQTNKTKQRWEFVVWRRSSGTSGRRRRRLVCRFLLSCTQWICLILVVKREEMINAIAVHRVLRSLWSQKSLRPNSTIKSIWRTAQQQKLRKPSFSLLKNVHPEQILGYVRFKIDFNWIN